MNIVKQKLKFVWLFCDNVALSYTIPDNKLELSIFFLTETYVCFIIKLLKNNSNFYFKESL